MEQHQTSIFDLSTDEKLQLVEDLWDDIASQPETVPVHEWQKAELARRDENLQKHPGTEIGWEEILKRVRNRYGR